MYGTNSSMQEMQDLSQEIEKKFGTELAACVKKHNIDFEDPIKLTNSVQARFAVYNHTIVKPNQEILQTYCVGNPSGAVPVRTYKDISGNLNGGFVQLKNLSDIDKKFWHGDSTMYSLDAFGELFTGEIKNGKVPQFIMDGLPKEYIQHYNLTEKDIINRISKGTNKIVANMLEDIATNPNSKLLQQGSPWFATLDPKVIDEAKQTLAKFDPQTVQNLEDLLPKLIKSQPSLAVLEQTTPLAKMAGVDMSKVVVGQIHQPIVAQAPTVATVTPKTPVTTPVAQPTAVTNPTTHVLNPVAGATTPTVTAPPSPTVTPTAPHTPAVTHTPNPTSSTTKAVEEGMSKTKIGLIVAGVALAAVGAYMFFKKDKKEEVAKAPQQELQQIQQPMQPAFAQSGSIFNQAPMNNQQSFQGYMPQYAYPQMNMYQGALSI